MGGGDGVAGVPGMGSPTDRARVEGDRPLECALCHADKTVAELVDTMERFWNKRYDRAALTALYGDLGASPLFATLERGKAHEQATAIHVLGEKGDRSALMPISKELTHPFPLVRYFARAALERLSGQSCDINLDQDDDRIAAAAARWFAETQQNARRCRSFSRF